MCKDCDLWRCGICGEVREGDRGLKPVVDPRLLCPASTPLRRICGALTACDPAAADNHCARSIVRSPDRCSLSETVS